MIFIPRANLRSSILGLLVFLSISSAIGWSHVSGPTVERPRPDMVQYLAIADGDRLAEVPAPFRYRPWTPWLAARVPDPPQAWLETGRPLTGR